MRGLKRRPARHARDGEAVTEALAAVPDPDWSLNLDVPAAQEEAVRAASGPQAVLPGQDEPGSWPRGQHRYGPPPPAGRPGSQHTRAWTPEFAEAGPMQRPYAPANSAPDAPAPLLPLPEDAVILPPAIGDHLEDHWTAPAGPENRSLDAWHEMCAVRYPARDLHATFRGYDGVLRRVSEITGTRGTRWWPMTALPAADERWSGLAASLADAAQVLGEMDPGLAAAHLRLREVVLAAPDCETALRAARVAAEAGITGHVSFTPGRPGRDGDAS